MSSWIGRQASDKFVRLRGRFAYRCRSAFKLYEIQEKFSVMKCTDVILDLGCSPGGWSQVASQFGKTVVAVDMHHMDSLKDVHFIHGDIRDKAILRKVAEAVGEGGVDVLVSDLAHSFTGSRTTDVARVHALVEFALSVAAMNNILKPHGHFVAKFLTGEDNQELFDLVASQFKSYHIWKPKSSRAESAESYIIAKDFNK